MPSDDWCLANLSFGSGVSEMSDIAAALGEGRAREGRRGWAGETRGKKVDRQPPVVLLRCLQRPRGQRPLGPSAFARDRPCRQGGGYAAGREAMNSVHVQGQSQPEPRARANPASSRRRGRGVCLSGVPGQLVRGPTAGRVGRAMGAGAIPAGCRPKWPRGTFVRRQAARGQAGVSCKRPLLATTPIRKSSARGCRRRVLEPVLVKLDVGGLIEGTGQGRLARAWLRWPSRVHGLKARSSSRPFSNGTPPPPPALRTLQRVESTTVVV
jgi:hypothetical protein